MTVDYGYGINTNDRPLSYDDYKSLLAAGQKYIAQAQANDPAWAAYNAKAASTNVENVGELPPAPTTDYWTQYLGTLAPEVAADFQRHLGDSKSWTDSVTPIMKLIPAAVGGIGLAGATGLLAGTQLGSAAGFPASGSIFSGAGAAGAGTGLEDVGGGMASLADQSAMEAALGGWDAGTSAAWATGSPGLGMDTVGAVGGSTGGFNLLDPSTWKMPTTGDAGGALGSAAKWAANNPGLISLLGGALAGAGAGSSQSTKPQKQYAPQPGLQMGLLQQPTLNQSPGLFTMGQGQGLANSGLARFGAKGGQFTPTAYNPQSFQWGQR